jgi:hypothetical protein
MHTNIKTLIHPVRRTILGVVAMLIAATVLFTSCEEEEDPFVDRHVAPVLIVFDGVTGYLAGGGVTSVPTRTYSISEADYTIPGNWAVSFYELDKSGILDHTIGIDSIPVSGLSIKFTLRNGTSLAELTSDGDGKVMAPLDWTSLVPSYASMAIGESRTVNVSWAGEHNGVAFTRYSAVVLRKI